MHLRTLADTASILVTYGWPGDDVSTATREATVRRILVRFHHLRNSWDAAMDSVRLPHQNRSRIELAEEVLACGLLMEAIISFLFAVYQGHPRWQQLGSPCAGTLLMVNDTSCSGRRRVQI